mmetsp:Transcript_14455/g.36593  ORF Transcript_14455/g.36593 Transcript_14455/m.36593 type:complete len:83 (+) Transcript_14455:982-1230(+)
MSTAYSEAASGLRLSTLSMSGSGCVLDDGADAGTAAGRDDASDRLKDRPKRAAGAAAVVLLAAERSGSMPPVSPVRRDGGLP